MIDNLALHVFENSFPEHPASITIVFASGSNQSFNNFVPLGVIHLVLFENHTAKRQNRQYLENKDPATQQQAFTIEQQM